MRSKYLILFLAAAVLAPLPAHAAPSIGLDQSQLIKTSASSDRGQLVSLDLQDAEVTSLLRMFSNIMNTNIVAHSEVGGKISALRLIDVPIEQAFRLVLRVRGLYASTNGNVTIVYPLSRFISDARSRLP